MSQIAKIRSYFSLYRSGEWLEYLLFIGFAVLMAMILANSGIKSIVLIMVVIIGLTIALLCFSHLEIGFYAIIGLGFLIASIDRIFMERIPVLSLLLLLSFPLFFLLLLRKIHHKDFSWFVWHPVILLYLFLTAYMVVELFNPQMDSFLGWLSAFWQRISYILFLFLSLYVLRDLTRVRFFMKFIFGALFITALYGCFQQWFGLSSFDTKWIYSDPHIYGLYSLPGGELRKFSFLSDPANFGTLMAGSGVATIILMMGPFSKKNKVIWGIFTLIILLGMSYSGTRTANIMLIAGIALYILMTIYKKRTQLLTMVAGMIFIFILFAPIYGSVTLNRFRTAFDSPSEDPSYNTRLIHREMMQPYMHKHPFGGGVNTAGGPGTKYNPNHFLAGFPPDGAYFAIALQEGWVGLALQLVFLFIILFYCVHYFYKCKSEEIKTYYAAMAGLLFSLFLGAYAQFTISSIPQSFIFVAFLALIIKLHTFDTPELSKVKP